MSGHSLLGGSGAYRWLNCPGSFALTRKLPPSKPSIYAVTGTIAHDYVERAIRSASWEIPVSEHGRVWSRDGYEITVDQDLVDGVDLMLDYVSALRSNATRMRCEFEVSLDPLLPRTPPVPLFGRLDVAVETPPVLEIIDFKNGAGVVVSPKDNPQLLYYAAGALLELDDPDVDEFTRVRLTIVQPHAPGIEQIRSWETSVVDVFMWVDEVLVPGVEACAQPNAPLVSGSWCRFCPAAFTCPRLQQDAIAMAKREFDDTVIPDAPAELATALDMAEHAQLWIDRLREHATEQLKAQVRIPGWGLVPTRPTRQWIDDEITTVTSLTAAGVGDEVIWETRLRSPAQVDKALSRTRLGRQTWADIHDLLVESRSSGVRLARTDRTDPAQEFTDADK